MFCIPALYSVMVLFCIEMCGSTFLQQQRDVFCVGCGPVSFMGGLSNECTTAHLRVGSGWRGKRCTAASNLPAEPVAALRGLKRMLYKTRGEGRWETIHSQHWYRLHSKNLMRDKSTDLFDLASGPVVFSQIKSFGHNDETTQQGAYLSLTQLQYKTVRKRLKTNCKKGFLCSCSTTHRRHCIPGFYIKALEVSFLCIYF